MKILDLDGKEREILSIKRISHQVVDAVNKGQYIQTELVEVVIKGKNRQWVDWYPIDEFLKINPTLVL